MVAMHSGIVNGMRHGLAFNPNAPRRKSPLAIVTPEQRPEPTVTNKRRPVFASAPPVAQYIRETITVDRRNVAQGAKDIRKIAGILQRMEEDSHCTFVLDDADDGPVVYPNVTHGHFVNRHGGKMVSTVTFGGVDEDGPFEIRDAPMYVVISFTYTTKRRVKTA